MAGAIMSCRSGRLARPNLSQGARQAEGLNSRAGLYGGGGY
jgi:hypothetical protein